MIPNPDGHILVTGGAGAISALTLTGELLSRVTGSPLWTIFCSAAICCCLTCPIQISASPKPISVSREPAIPAVRKDWPAPQTVIHLAAIAGFPACQAVGQQVAWRYNVEATQRTYEQGVQLGVERFIYASSYTVYGFSSAGSPVSEATPLNPQSLYAETKAASESFLMEEADLSTPPLDLPLQLLYGLSPRTRFDMIVNQFILEAFTKRELLIYQRGYSWAFIHIHDAVQGLLLGLGSPPGW